MTCASDSGTAYFKSQLQEIAAHYIGELVEWVNLNRSEVILQVHLQDNERQSYKIDA